MLALREAAQGEAGIITKKAAAYQTLSTLKFSGRRGAHVLEQHLSAFQKAINTLETLGEPVPAGKQVQDLLDSFTTDKFMVTRGIINSKPALLTDFSKTVAFIKMQARGWSWLQDRDTRRVDKVSTGNSERKRRAEDVDTTNF